MNHNLFPSHPLLSVIGFVRASGVSFTDLVTFDQAFLSIVIIKIV
jgi:hypothetical protein